ncbi:MAG: gamma-glutamyltransferase [Acidimicrobiales bacterium]|nr:gamma-glutamyltransferase [Acidimicrobiales bacterium]
MSVGLVAGGHPEVCRAAATLLEQGGNAFDAVVAAGFAAAVAEPTLSSLGGGGFLLARTAAGDATVFDFFVDTPGRGLAAPAVAPHFEPVTIAFPGSDQVFNVGRGSVAVPGCLAGYLHVHERLGCRPLSDVVAPAVGLASGGVVATPMAAALVALLWPIFERAPDTHALFAPHGHPLRVGERLVNPDLAAFLAQLGDDPGHTFHRGAQAEALAADMAAGGGLVTEEDLAAYQVVEREPLALGYRGRRVLTNPAPSFGGSLVALTLGLLEDGGTLPERGSPDHAAALTEAMVETDRLRSGGDVDPRPRVSRGTTHVSVADRYGNAASMTTSNGEASGHLVPGTGILLNNMLGEDDLHPHGFHAAPAGQRVASMMSPTMVLDDGDPRLVVGSGGSKRIRTTIVQVVSAVVDHGVDVREAIEAPRLHWDGEQVQIEPGWAPAAVDALRRRWPVNEWGERNLYFGGAHAVVPAGPGGAGRAAGDPRRGGDAIVVPAG